eukprot:934168-Amphidinium_carterae.1
MDAKGARNGGLASRRWHEKAKRNKTTRKRSQRRQKSISQSCSSVILKLFTDAAVSGAVSGLRDLVTASYPDTTGA